MGGATIFLAIIAATVVFLLAGGMRSWRHFLVASLISAVVIALIAGVLELAG